MNIAKLKALGPTMVSIPTLQHAGHTIIVSGPDQDTLARRIGYLVQDIRWGIVHASAGDIEIDLRTGEVLHLCEEAQQDHYLLRITSFNVREYFQYWVSESPLDINEFDILDLGFTLTDQTYAPPEKDWRISVKKDALASMGVHIVDNGGSFSVRGEMRSFSSEESAVNFAYRQYFEV